MLVSVIIPTYNAERWISETLASVFHQTYQNLEIVLVDDGSKDRTGVGIDLMNLAAPRLPYPQRSLGPRETRIAAAARRRDRGEHTAGLRIDLVDTILGDLEQVLAVEGRSCM